MEEKELKEYIIFDETIKIENEPIKNNTTKKVGNSYLNVRVCDHNIFYECNIQGIIHSNENCGENTPHIHVIIDREFEIVISLIKYEVIENETSLKRKKIDKAIELVKKYSDKCIRKWNEVDSKIKIHN